MQNKPTFISLLLIFVGTCILLNNKNIPILIPFIFILIGHIIYLYFNNKKKKIILLDLCNGLILFIYYIILNNYNLGILNNIMIGFILYLIYKKTLKVQNN